MLRTLPEFSCYVPWAFTFRKAEGCLLGQLGCKTLEPFGLVGHEAAVSASGALVEYLRETQKNALKIIDSVKYAGDSDCTSVLILSCVRPQSAGLLIVSRYLRLCSFFAMFTTLRVHKLLHATAMP